jgi:Kef-type K+ transport system membrane component KefB
VIVLLDLLLILVVARAAGAAFQRIGQPAVVGEILTGILLGPTVLGAAFPELPGRLFPVGARSVLQVFANFGLVAFVFSVGLRLNFGRIPDRDRTTAGIISASSVAAPFCLGAALSVLLYPSHGTVDSTPVDPILFALFMGVAMSMTAFPVLGRILAERKMLSTRIGALVLACAAVDDVLGWCLLAVVVALVDADGSGALVVTLLGSTAFVAFMLAVARPLLAALPLDRAASARQRCLMLAALTASLAASGWATRALGLHLVFGALLFGAIMPRTIEHTLRQELKRLAEGISLMFLPVFFALPMLGVDLRSLERDRLGEFGLIMLAACAGKFLGSALPARLRGFEWREATAVGALMNTRGVVEVIVLNVGLAAGILDPALFGMLIAMALLTTCMAGPILSLTTPSGSPRLSIDELTPARRGRAGLRASRSRAR